MSRREEVRDDRLTAMPDFEKIVVGEALQSGDFFWRQADKIRPQHFTIPRLGRIWQAMLKASEKGRPPTKTWVPLYIDPVDSREDVPLMIELNLLINNLEEGREPDQAAEEVFNLANKRSMLDACVTVHSKILKSDVTTTPAQMQNIAMSGIAAAIDQGHEAHQKSYADWGSMFYEKVAANLSAGEESQGLGLSCGLSAVEEVIGRLLPGKLYILAGMSGSGKSALARQITEAAMKDADRHGMGVGYIGSLEMTGEDYAIRALSHRMGIPFRDLEKGVVDRAQLDTLYEHVQRLRKSNIIIDDTPNQTFDQMKAQMQKIKLTKGLALAVIDHLLIIGAEKGESLFDKVTNSTMKAKNAAKEFGIPIIVLAQLTEKKILDSPSGWPNTSHLFGGETIAQNADSVAFVHRHELVLRKREPDPERTEAHDKWRRNMDSYQGKGHFFVDKQRGGESGQGATKREMRFIGPTMYFEDQ